MMLRPLEVTGDRSWLGAFSRDYHRRFLSLLGYQFRKFHPIMALSIDESANAGAALDDVPPRPVTKDELDQLMTP